MRVSEADKRKFERLAESRNTDLSELVRQLLFRELKTEKQGQAA